MTESQNQKYAYYMKVAWAIYILLTIVVIAVLVLFVAQDDEERFFYGLMPAAAAYVLRPTERVFSKYILKFTGVSKTSENE